MLLGVLVVIKGSRGHRLVFRYPARPASGQSESAQSAHTGPGLGAGAGPGGPGGPGAGARPGSAATGNGLVGSTTATNATNATNNAPGAAGATSSPSSSSSYGSPSSVAAAGPSMGSGTGAAAFSSFSSPAPSHPGTPGPTGSAGANSTLNAPASASGFMAGSAGSAAAAAAAAAVGPASLTGASGPASSSSSSASNQTANQALRKRYAQWGSGAAPDGLAAPDASTASTDKFGSTFGFTSQLLAEMLSPKNALCDQPFELKINDLLFVGHPILLPKYEDFISAEELGEEDEDFKSHQRPSPVMQLFHLVFVFQAGLCTSIFRDYQTLVSHLTAAFRHEELRCGFLSEQVQILIDILDSNAILPSAGAAGTPGPGAPGLDMPAASSQDWQHHAPTTAPSFPAFADATGPPQPSVPAKARPPIPKLVTAASSPALFATSANRASSAMAAASGNSSQVLTQPAAQQLPPTLNLIDAREAITNEILRRCKLAQYVQHIFNTLRPGSSAAGVSIKVNGWIEVTLPVRPMNEPDLRLTHKDYLRRHREQRQQQQHMYHQHEPHTILNTYRAYSFGGAGSSHSNGGVVPVAEIHIPNGNTSVTVCTQPVLFQPLSEEAVQQEVLNMRPYHTLLLRVDALELLASLPPDSSPSLRRLVQHASPLRTLLEMSQEVGIPLQHIFRLSAHLVHWQRASVTHTLSRSNVYSLSPCASLAVNSPLVSEFSSNFKQGPSLHMLLSRFSYPRQLGDHMASIPPEKQTETLKMVVWLLRHDLLVHLKAYLYLVTPFMPVVDDRSRGSRQRVQPAHSISESAPGGPVAFGGPAERERHVSSHSSSSSSSSSSSRAIGSESLDANTQLSGANSLGKDAPVDDNLPKDSLSDAELQSVDELFQVTRAELGHIRSVYAGYNSSDVDQFLGLAKYFRGRHHVEEIMFRENLERVALMRLLERFSKVLVTCWHE